MEPASRRTKLEMTYLQNMKTLVFVPDERPTLEVNIGKEISLLKDIGFHIAVITNASLLWREK